LYYNRFRYYDKDSGQYISPDPIGLLGGLNPYGYVHDPVGWVDPFGLAGGKGNKGEPIKPKLPDIVELNPKDIRFSQSSVNGAAELTESMKLKGWAGDPIDVVRMKDGGLTTIDNTRVLAASRAGVNVQARIHDGSTALPNEFVGRFTTSKGTPSTWEDAIQLRIGKQNSGYRNTYPDGSNIIGSME
ncbi:RHS repeat-associated core domain-containing protein, partial [Providencia manganoxydans]|uniref:RHS repeat-associated core domain-containing protein n=1 Tax=Providencia manganoxydans TaxID=2923283 RepID=UPI0032D9C737